MANACQHRGNPHKVRKFAGNWVGITREHHCFHTHLFQGGDCFLRIIFNRSYKRHAAILTPSTAINDRCATGGSSNSKPSIMQTGDIRRPPQDGICLVWVLNTVVTRGQFNMCLQPTIVGDFVVGYLDPVRGSLPPSAWSRASRAARTIACAEA